jgi:hypothetical protein
MLYWMDVNHLCCTFIPDSFIEIKVLMSLHFSRDFNAFDLVHFKFLARIDFPTVIVRFLLKTFWLTQQHFSDSNYPMNCIWSSWEQLRVVLVHEGDFYEMIVLNGHNSFPKSSIIHPLCHIFVQFQVPCAKALPIDDFWVLWISAIQNMSDSKPAE